MSIVEKLRSFDADIRYMGLSDMQKAVAARRADPEWPALVVALLGDTALDVQNLAIRVVADMAALEAAELASLVLASSAPATVRAVALKAVIQNSRLVPRDAVQAVLAALRRDPVFDTIEGAEAVLELLQHPAKQAPFKNSKNDIYDYAVQLTAHPGLLRMRGFGILALTLPALSDDDWNSFARRFVHHSATAMRDAAALTLLGKLAGNVPNAWLIPEFEDILCRYADTPSDVEMCEAALEALAALYDLDGFSQPRADALAQRYLRYSEYGGSDGAAADGDSDDEMRWDGASDDSEWFDESSRVRKAAAKLAGKSSSIEMTRAVFAAAGSEVDESARSAMYSVLTTLSALHNKDDANLPFDVLGQRVLRDVTQNNWIAASAGLKVLVSQNMQPLVSRIVREAASKRPALLHQYITMVRSANNDDTTNNDDDTRWIIRRALDADIAAVPETTIYALGLATEFGLSQFALDAARLTKSSSYAEPLRIAALQATGKLATQSDWPEAIPLVLHCLRAEPALRPAALDCLERAAMSEVSTDEAREIVFAVNEILNVANSPTITSKCCAVLSSLPDSVAPEIVQTILHLKDDDRRDEKEVVLMKRARALQPGVLEWAFASKALNLLRFLAVEADKSIVEEALAQSDVPEVHAASAGTRWQLLDGRYQFTRTDFSSLSSAQLRVLLALARNGIDWNWYTVETMLKSSFEENAAVKGSIVGLVAVNSNADDVYIANAPSLPEEALEPSFTAYASRTRDKHAVFSLAQKHAQLQIPASLATAITSPEDLAAFLTLFEHGAASIMIATIKLLHGAVLVNSLPTLLRFLRNTSLDSATRAEACMTLAWILQTVAEARTQPQYADEMLTAFARALEPISDQVQTLNIGPFKHRVDLNLPLRQAAIDGIYTCAALVRLASYRHTVDAVVSHGLHDEFEVKIVAYRTIAVLADLDIEAVRARLSTIESICDADVSNKPKDNAVKEDVEKHLTLVMTINDVREHIASFT